MEMVRSEAVDLRRDSPRQQISEVGKPVPFRGCEVYPGGLIRFVCCETRRAEVQMDLGLNPNPEIPPLATYREYGEGSCLRENAVGLVRNFE